MLKNLNFIAIFPCSKTRNPRRSLARSARVLTVANLESELQVAIEVSQSQCFLVEAAAIMEISLAVCQQMNCYKNSFVELIHKAN